MSELATLADDVGVNERTLRRAVNEGTLRGGRPTPRTLELPLGERAYIRRTWSLLAALRGALRTEHNVRAAFLFGSAAAGRDTPASDIDILVDLRDPNLERVVDLSMRLTEATGRPVDLLRLQDVEADPLLLEQVLSEARVLVDREGQWPAWQDQAAGANRRARRQRSDRARSALSGIDRLVGT